jgi:hypothetical protein
MKPLIYKLGFLLAILLFGCATKNSTDQKEKNSDATKNILHSDTRQEQRPSIPDFSTNQKIFPDTKQLQQKRLSILKTFYYTPSVAADYDTLVDVNYDGYRDYLISDYGASGTGYKYKIKVYMYSTRRKTYFLDKQLSSLVNPSFFIREHKITGFYIGLGGGWGRKLEWIKNRWIITKEFDVDNNGDSTIWEVNYPLRKEKGKVIRRFQMLPPVEILESNLYLK